MKRRFFAYKDVLGIKKEPDVPHKKILFTRKTINGAIRFATKMLGARCAVYLYTDYFDRKTFECIYSLKE